MTDRVIDLLTDYRDEAPTAFRVPELSDMEAGAWRQRRRRRRRQRLTLAFVMPAALLLVVAIGLVRPEPAPPEPPAPVAASIYTVDWTRTELTLPHNPDNRCPEGRVRMYPRDFMRFGRVGLTPANPDVQSSSFEILGTAPAYGDLTGDGRPEAVLAIRCSVFPDGSAMEQEGAQTLVVTMRPDHSLVGLQFVGTVHAEYPSFHVDGGRLYVQMRYNHASANSWGSSYLDAAFTQVYLWNGASFALIAGRTGPLNFTGAHNGYGVPSQLADILSSDGQVLCPAALVPFAYAPFSNGGYVYGGPGGRQEARPVDVDGDGNEEIVVAVNCAGPDYDAVSLYVLTQGSDRFVTLDVPLANDGTYTLESFEATTAGLTLTVSSATEGRQVKVLFWDGTGYQPSYGSFRLARPERSSEQT